MQSITTVNAMFHPEPAVSVLLIDDHSLISDLVSSYLTMDPGFTVECAADLPAGLDLIRAKGMYDVVLLDVVLPGMTGLHNVTEVVQANKDGAVVLFSGAVSASYVEKAIDLGVRGYIPKTLSLRALTSAIRLVATEQSFVPGNLVYKSARVESARARLTEIEAEVLSCLSQGRPNKDIAFLMKISEASVKMHVRLICRKLDAKNRTHAVSLAKAEGLLGPV